MSTAWPTLMSQYHASMPRRPSHCWRPGGPASGCERRERRTIVIVERRSVVLKAIFVNGWIFVPKGLQVVLHILVPQKLESQGKAIRMIPCHTRELVFMSRNLDALRVPANVAQVREDHAFDQAARGPHHFVADPFELVELMPGPAEGHGAGIPNVLVCLAARTHDADPPH